MSTNAVLPDNAMVTTGKTGAFCSIYTLIAAYEGANSDPNAEYVPVPAPKVNAEDTVKLNMYYLLGPCITVSADSPNAELCVKWLDYLFSEEGALLANYGTEGDTFEYQEDGTPVFTSKVTANEDYTFAQAMAYFTMPPSVSACRTGNVSLPPFRKKILFPMISGQKLAPKTVCLMSVLWVFLQTKTKNTAKS